MKTLLIIVSALLMQNVIAQKFNVPDSVMEKYATMICNCSNKENFSTKKQDAAITIIGKCIKDVTAVYSFSDEAATLKTAFETKETSDKFNEYTIDKLLEFCPSFKTFFDKNINNTPEIKISPLATVKEAYFLDSKKMAAKKMTVKNNGTQMRTWSAIDFGKIKVQIVYDIRYQFKNEEDAKKYYKQDLPFLSEKAPEVANELKTLGVSESNVYSDNSGAAFGLDMKMKNYIFRIKNVIAKVFVSATAKATDAEMLQFAKDAIARIKALK